jgi:hypothetical protein
VPVPNAAQRCDQDSPFLHSAVEAPRRAFRTIEGRAFRGVHEDIRVESARLTFLKNGLVDPIVQWTCIPADVMSDLSELVVARAFSLPDEAHLACSVLHAAGLDARVADEYTVKTDWLLSNAVGGVKVMVRAEDLTTARELLEQTAVLSDDDASLQMLDTEDSEEDVCPRCRNRKWVPVTLGKRLAVWSWLIVGMPLYPVRRRWQCGHCGHLVK